MRRQQNVELSVFSDGKAGQILAWLRDRILPVHIPGVIAADDKVLLLLTLERSAAATARGIVSLPAGDFLPRVTGIVVDSARVSGHLETRPIVLGTEALTNGSIPAGSGILDGSHVVRTHRFHRGLQYAASILRAQGISRDDERDKNTGNTQLSCHRASLCKVEVPNIREYIAPLHQQPNRFSGRLGWRRLIGPPPSRPRPKNPCRHGHARRVECRASNARHFPRSSSCTDLEPAAAARRDEA